MVRILRKFTISEFNEILQLKCYGGLRFRKFNEILWSKCFGGLRLRKFNEILGQNSS